MPRLGDSELWLAPVRSRRHWIGLLSSEERARAESIPDGRARHRFVTSRGMQRLIGGHYTRTDPKLLQIDRTCPRCGVDHGRPRLVGAEVDYSVSHTGRWVMVGVMRGGLIGVDLERRPDRRTAEQVASRTMTPNELDVLARTPEGVREAEFLRLWTRKEAAAKLTGLGVAAELHRLDASEPILAGEAAPPNGRAAAIHLLDFPVDADHTAAMASTRRIKRVVPRSLSELEAD